MSPSLASHAIVGLLRVTGVKKRQFKPSRFLTEVANPSPPRLPGVTVRREEVEGWPVYRLTPVDPVKHYALYIHGGAWAAPITTRHWRLAARIAVESGREVVLPLYPRLPAATHADVLPVMLDLFQHVQKQGPTALMGDSAGANIALPVLQALTPQGERPDITVLISPCLTTWSYSVARLVRMKESSLPSHRFNAAITWGRASSGISSRPSRMGRM